MGDKVMHPTQTGNSPGIVKQVNRGPIKGPTGSASRLMGFNKKKKK